MLRIMTSSLLVLYSGYMVVGTVVGVRQASELGPRMERRYGCVDALSTNEPSVAVAQACAAR